MPTGYTSGILTGKIKTFKQFATQCIRAFGATIHMRDDSWDAEYKPDKVGDYYVNEVKDITKKINKLKKLSDNEVLEMKKKDLLDQRKRYLGYIKERKENEIKLNKFLEEANKYVPPTSEHNGIKQFMIQQLTDTLSWDGDVSYYEKEISELDKIIDNLNSSEIRKELMDDYLNDLKRCQNRLSEEEKNVNERNEWAKQYLESLKNLK